MTMIETDESVTYRTKGRTKAIYGKLNEAYDFFNGELFDGALPDCLITLQRHRGAYGYFCGDRFEDAESTLVDEIALNPTHFAVRPVREVLSTLVHEMAHLWQHRFGKSSRNGYHNKEWGRKMKEIGLWPSSTGKEGGKETGQKVSHYIMAGEGYDKASDKYAEIDTLELLKEHSFGATKKKKNNDKVKYTCPNCAAKAWGKANLHIDCGLCQKRMRCGGGDMDGGDDD